jgi:hypothetical protein
MGPNWTWMDWHEVQNSLSLFPLAHAFALHKSVWPDTSTMVFIRQDTYEPGHAQQVFIQKHDFVSSRSTPAPPTHTLYTFQHVPNTRVTLLLHGTQGTVQSFHMQETKTQCLLIQNNHPIISAFKDLFTTQTGRWLPAKDIAKQMILSEHRGVFRSEELHVFEERIAPCLDVSFERLRHRLHATPQKQKAEDGGPVLHIMHVFVSSEHGKTPRICCESKAHGALGWPQADAPARRVLEEDPQAKLCLLSKKDSGFPMDTYAALHITRPHCTSASSRRPPDLGKWCPMSDILAHMRIGGDTTFGMRVTAYLLGPLMDHFWLYHPALSDSAHHQINVLQVNLTRHGGVPYIQMQRSSDNKYWTLPSHQPFIRAYEYESLHPKTQWLFLAPYHNTFRYNTYAALHIIQKTNSEVGSYSPHLSYMPDSYCWHPFHEVCTSVQMQNEQYTREKIYPYLEEKYPQLL